MASVTLTDLWMNDLENPADFLALRYSSLNDTPQARAEVREYAGGVRRVIRRLGTSRSLAVTVMRVGNTEREWLVAHLGRVVVVRDGRGRRMHAVYTQVPMDDVPGVGYSSGQLQFELVSDPNAAA